MAKLSIHLMGQGWAVPAKSMRSMVSLRANILRFRSGEEGE
jgi:hypothetical protein